ncbi:MAG: YggT family protein [Pseudonocardiaceae bacterium]
MGALLALVGFALLLFQLLLLGRIIVDLVGVLAKPGVRYEESLAPVRHVIYQLTEPVLAPVRRVVRPVQMGGVMFDLSVTAVFLAVVVLRQLTLVA